eukprot:snap_masked-scaffold_19-processed-gene-4.4-mRNA-1 protein AED:1.00 eAED:1.00 QI:0/-1/0/0/-1/1/1/0/348
MSGQGERYTTDLRHQTDGSCIGIGCYKRPDASNLKDASGKDLWTYTQLTLKQLSGVDKIEDLEKLLPDFDRNKGVFLTFQSINLSPDGVKNIISLLENFENINGLSLELMILEYKQLLEYFNFCSRKNIKRLLIMNRSRINEIKTPCIKSLVNLKESVKEILIPVSNLLLGVGRVYNYLDFWKNIDKLNLVLTNNLQRFVGEIFFKLKQAEIMEKLSEFSIENIEHPSNFGWYCLLDMLTIRNYYINSKKKIVINFGDSSNFVPKPLWFLLIPDVEKENTKSGESPENSESSQGDMIRSTLNIVVLCKQSNEALLLKGKAANLNMKYYDESNKVDVNGSIFPKISFLK